MCHERVRHLLCFLVIISYIMRESSVLLIQTFQVVCLILKLVYFYFYIIASIYLSHPPNSCNVTIPQIILVTGVILIGLVATITCNIIYSTIYTSMNICLYLSTIIACGLVDPINFILDTIILILSLLFFEKTLHNDSPPLDHRFFKNVDLVHP